MRSSFAILALIVILASCYEAGECAPMKFFKKPRQSPRKPLANFKGYLQRKPKPPIRTRNKISPNSQPANKPLRPPPMPPVPSPESRRKNLFATWTVRTEKRLSSLQGVPGLSGPANQPSPTSPEKSRTMQSGSRSPSNPPPPPAVPPSQPSGSSPADVLENLAKTSVALRTPSLEAILKMLKERPSSDRLQSPRKFHKAGTSSSQQSAPPHDASIQKKLAEQRSAALKDILKKLQPLLVAEKKPVATTEAYQKCPSVQPESGSPQKSAQLPEDRVRASVRRKHMIIELTFKCENQILYLARIRLLWRTSGQ